VNEIKNLIKNCSGEKNQLKPVYASIIFVFDKIDQFEFFFPLYTGSILFSSLSVFAVGDFQPKQKIKITKFKFLN
jgi:ATP-dependent helicase YprA (DUF1998 family)